MLKALATSRSTVAVAFGTPSGRTAGEAVRLVEPGVFAALDFGSGVTAELGSVVGGGVAASGFDGLFAAVALLLSTAGLSGRAN